MSLEASVRELFSQSGSLSMFMRYYLFADATHEQSSQMLVLANNNLVEIEDFILFAEEMWATQVARGLTREEEISLFQKLEEIIAKYNITPPGMQHDFSAVMNNVLYNSRAKKDELDAEVTRIRSVVEEDHNVLQAAKQTAIVELENYKIHFETFAHEHRIILQLVAEQLGVNFGIELNNLDIEE